MTCRVTRTAWVWLDKLKNSLYSILPSRISFGQVYYLGKRIFLSSFRRQNKSLISAIYYNEAGPIASLIWVKEISISSAICQFSLKMSIAVLRLINTIAIFCRLSVDREKQQSKWMKLDYCTLVLSLLCRLELSRFGRVFLTKQVSKRIYLPDSQVNYRCVSSKPSDVELVRVCESGRHRIECPNNRKINVVSANYGHQKGAHICGGLVLSTWCGASTSMPVVRHDFQEKQQCELIATNAKFGGDPCFLTSKHLEISQGWVTY